MPSCRGLGRETLTMTSDAASRASIRHVTLRGVGRNSLFNVVGQLLPLVVAVVTLPIVIRQLGPARFGVLSLVWASLNYLTIFDMGLGRAVTWYASSAIGRRQFDQIWPVTWCAVATQGMLGALVAVVAIALAPTAASLVVHDPSELQAEAAWCFTILALAVPVVTVSRSFRGVLEAAQRFDLINFVRTPASAANFLLPVVAVWAGLGLPGIVALFVLTQVFVLVVTASMAARLFPGIWRGRTWRQGLLADMFRFGGWVNVSTIVGPLLATADRFMIGAFVGVSTLTFYAAPQEIITRLWIIPTGLLSAAFPALTASYAEGNEELSSALAVRSIKALVLVVGAAVVVLLALSGDLLTWWLGVEFAEQSAACLKVLAVGALIGAVAQVPYSMIHAAGRPDVTARFHLIELPIYVLAVWLVVPRWGIVGAAYAWTCRLALDASLLFWASGRLGVHSPRRLLDAHLGAAIAITGLAAAAAGLIGIAIPAPSTRLGAMVFVACCATIPWWSVALNDGERAEVTRWLTAWKPQSR